jgi:type VI secretion system protein ImpM
MTTPDFAHSTLGFSTAQHVAQGQRMVRPTNVRLDYFGKLPSRGDFVRGAHQPALMQQLDAWVSRAMDALSEDVRWKATFDAATPLHFVFLGPRDPVGLAGYVVPSQDASGRRFPFMTTGTFDVAEPARFMAMSPLALTRLWSRLATSARLAQAAPDLSDAQPQLDAGAVQVDTAPDAHLASFEKFAAATTLADLETMLLPLGGAAAPVVRQAVLAVGLLLAPTLRQGFAGMDKALALPLPAEPAQRAAVAAFWLALVTRFALRDDVELAVFFAPHLPRPRMLVGFAGASSTLLQGLLDPALAAAQGVDVSEAAWVEDWVSEAAGATPGVRRLSGYLQEPQLSLKQVMATFREAFNAR